MKKQNNSKTTFSDAVAAINHVDFSDAIALSPYLPHRLRVGLRNRLLRRVALDLIAAGMSKSAAASQIASDFSRAARSSNTNTYWMEIARSLVDRKFISKLTVYSAITAKF